MCTLPSPVSSAVGVSASTGGDTIHMGSNPPAFALPPDLTAPAATNAGRPGSISTRLHAPSARRPDVVDAESPLVDEHARPAVVLERRLSLVAAPRTEVLHGDQEPHVFAALDQAVLVALHVVDHLIRVREHRTRQAVDLHLELR